MALYPAAAMIEVPSLIATLAIAGFAAWRARTAPAAASWLPLAGLLVTLVLAAGAFALFPAERPWPIVAGLALGAIVGALWEWRFAGSGLASGHVASGVAALALLGLWQGEAVPFANAALGLLLGWAVWPLLSRLATGAGGGSAAGLAVVATLAGAAAWGEKLVANAEFGAPLAVGLGATLAIAMAVGERVAESGRARLGAAASAVIFAIAALGWVLGLYAQPPALALAVIGGAALGALAPVLVGEGDASAPVASLAVLLLGGVLLVVDNRLMGIVAMGLGGAGLACGMVAAGRVREVLALLAAIFAARVWLQLFLDRTLLTAYGVDLTHPYAFAALVAGGLLPLVAVLGARLTRPDAPLASAWALVVLGAPVWVGYFIHVEALGSLLAGLLLAAFVLGLAGPAAGSAQAEARSALPALLIAAVATTLLAAPWLVSVMNATRMERLVVLLVGLAVLLVGLGYWWARVAKRQAIPA